MLQCVFFSIPTILGDRSLGIGIRFCQDADGAPVKQSKDDSR